MESIQEHHGELESNAPGDGWKLEHSAKPSSHKQIAKDPLTMLPVELQNMSLEFLNILDKLSLKFVNKYFHAFIPPYTHKDYLEAEKLVGARGIFYACCICHRFRPRAKFADNARVQTKGPGASKAKDRFCLECGLKPDPKGYTRLCRNTWVIINKEQWIVCFQCGNLGRAHKGNGTNWCEDCWRLDLQPRLETHANHVLPSPVHVQEQRRLGETWISTYSTPHDVVQSAMLVGVSTPNAFAKHKKWDQNGEEAVVSNNFHASEEEMAFNKKSYTAHPKLVNGKKSKREYKERYRVPFMTRSEAHKARAAAGPETVTDDGLAMHLDTPAPTDHLANDGDSNGGPGPSTLALATKKAHLAAEADLTMDTDTPATASVPQQNGNPTPALLVTDISTAQEGSSQHPNPKHPAHIPIWAQMAISQPSSLPPAFIPRSAIQSKSSRHPEATGPVHIPIWARETTTQESRRLSPEATVPATTHDRQPTTQVSAQNFDCKAPQNLSPRAQNAVTLGASTADTINTKDQRDFARPRYSFYDDMDLKPPCSLKVTLKANSYSKKPAAPITCNTRGNSGNIIAMNYLKARHALHQLDRNSKLGWYTIRTVNRNTKAEVNSVRANNLTSTCAQPDNSRKRRASDDGLFEMLLRKGSLPTEGDNKKRRIEEDSEEEFKGFSDRSNSPSPEPVNEVQLQDLRVRAMATMKSNNPKKRKASTTPDAAGSKSAFAHYHNQLVENIQKKPRVGEDSDDSFEGFIDSDSSWKGCED